MIKKALHILFLLMFGLSITACSAPRGADTTPTGQGQSTAGTEQESPQQTGSPEPEAETSQPEQDEAEGSAILVVYFSCTGTTKTMAEYAAEHLEADLYEIVPEEPYTEDDLAYYTGGRADREQNDPAARPAISGAVEHMEAYDTILLGYPIWHGQAPRIISTFLESYDFSGKTIIPFCTSHSSGMGSSAEELHTLCPDSVNWDAGRRFGSGTSREEVADWLQELPL